MGLVSNSFSFLQPRHGLIDVKEWLTAMSVTLRTTAGDIKIEVFCEAVPKTAEVSSHNDTEALTVC